MKNEITDKKEAALLRQPRLKSGPGELITT